MYWQWQQKKRWIVAANIWLGLCVNWMQVVLYIHPRFPNHSTCVTENSVLLRLLHKCLRCLWNHNCLHSPPTTFTGSNSYGSTEVYWGEHLVVCILMAVADNEIGGVVCWSIQFKLLLNFHNILLTTRALLYPATGVYRPFKAPLGMATIIVQKKGSTQFKVASRLHLLCKCHLKRERKKSYIYTSWWSWW